MRTRGCSGLDGRLDGFHFDVENQLGTVNSGSESAVIASPKASLIFAPNPTWETYLSGGLGFHSNDARGTVVTGDPATGEPAEPVDPTARSRCAKIGVRVVPVEGLHSTVSLWYLGVDSELVYVGDGGGTEPSDESRRVGVEWTNPFRPLPELTIELDLAVSRGRFTGVPEDEDHVPGVLENVIAGGAT